MRDQVLENELFEKVPVLRSVLTLAIPTVISQIILVVYNMADTFFIGMTGSDTMMSMRGNSSWARFHSMA